MRCPAIDTATDTDTGTGAGAGAGRSRDVQVDKFDHLLLEMTVVASDAKASKALLKCGNLGLIIVRTEESV